LQAIKPARSNTELVIVNPSTSGSLQKGAAGVSSFQAPSQQGFGRWAWVGTGRVESNHR
jgi:hypothetical protein